MRLAIKLSFLQPSLTFQQHFCSPDWGLVTLLHQINLPRSERASPSAFIPLWILPSSFSALAAGAFCIQIGVQGAWGVVSRLVALLWLAVLHHADIRYS